MFSASLMQVLSPHAKPGPVSREFLNCRPTGSNPGINGGSILVYLPRKRGIKPGLTWASYPHVFTKCERTVQLYVRLDRPFAAIEEQFNYPDPFGNEWRGMETGMVTLRPGQSVTWKQRLELFAPQSHGN